MNKHERMRRFDRFLAWVLVVLILLAIFGLTHDLFER